MRAHRTPSTTAAVVLLAFLALLTTTTHTITKGETLAGIASRYDTTVALLASANGIADPNRIIAGRQLQVPSAAAASTAPTSPAPISTAPTSAAGTARHIVQRGDTLGRIAALYRISQSQIIAANGLTGDRIYLGQRLLLLARAVPAPTAPPVESSFHVVAAGETLSRIAQRYGTTIKAIEDLNGISDPNLIVAGQRLTIPGAPTAASVLVCPLQGTMRYMNDWGFPRSGGRFHEGNDLFATRGTPALAMVNGIAIQTVGLIGGNQVKVVGDDGVVYYYTHLDSFGTAGRVRAGDVIGHVGNTGNAIGGPTHIHFEMHPGGGAAVNPYPILAKAC